jgi:hypothetical protein
MIRSIGFGYAEKRAIQEIRIRWRYEIREDVQNRVGKGWMQIQER